MPRTNTPKLPAPAPVETAIHMKAPAHTARPEGWTLQTIALASRPGETLTARAYVSPDGWTAIHRVVGDTSKRAPHYMISAIVDARAWSTHKTTPKDARACATVAAAINAEHLQGLQGIEPGSRAWMRAGDALREAYAARLHFPII